MKRKNYFMISLILIGAILFGIVSFVIIRANRTVNAVVPNQEIMAGTVITSEMLSVVQVPVDTPQGYITDRSSLVGQKLKITAQPGQFLYMSDVMLSWNDVVYGVSVPDDYVITALKIPNDRAVGGIITAGDTVDILGVPMGQNQNGNKVHQQMDGYLGEMATHSYGADGVHVYWILANVKILETDSSLSSQDDSVLASITDAAGAGGEEGAYYIVALSYEDYQKVILAQQYLNLWMNIAPAWNNEHDPLLEIMTYAQIQALSDAQEQSILESHTDENGNVTYSIKKEAIEEYKRRQVEWMEENGYELIDENGNPVKLHPEEPNDVESETGDLGETVPKADEKEPEDSTVPTENSGHGTDD